MSQLFGMLVVLMGWPAVVGSLALSAMGMVWGRPLYLVAAGALYTPFCWYLSVTPKYGPGALYLPLLMIPAALAVYHRRAPLAWVLLALLIILSVGGMFIP